MTGIFRDQGWEAGIPGGAALLVSPALLPACVLRCCSGHLGIVLKPQSTEGPLCFDSGRDTTSIKISPIKDKKRQSTKEEIFSSTYNVGRPPYPPKECKFRQDTVFHLSNHQTLRKRVYLLPGRILRNTVFYKSLVAI